MDVVVVLSFDYFISHNAVDGILVFHVVFRGFREQFWSRAEVNLDSGDVDCRVSFTASGKFQSNVVRSYLEHLEGIIGYGR